MDLFSAERSREFAYQDTAGIVAEQSRDHFGTQTFLDPAQSRSDRPAVFWGMQVRGRGVGKALLDQSSGRLDFSAVAGPGQRSQVNQQRGLAAQSLGHGGVALYRRIPFGVGQHGK